MYSENIFVSLNVFFLFSFLGQNGEIGWNSRSFGRFISSGTIKKGIYQGGKTQICISTYWQETWEIYLSGNFPLLQFIMPKSNLYCSRVKNGIFEKVKWFLKTWHIWEMKRNLIMNNCIMFVETETLDGSKLNGVPRCGIQNTKYNLNNLSTSRNKNHFILIFSNGI